MSETADGTESTEPESTEPESTEDAARRKFREALDRKKFGHHGHDGGAHDPRSSAPHSSPAKPQRTFRRKSG
ncbi:MAG: DUF5302 domain-containing protein [Kineosporiaceae bacterium]|nr:DUF5302 domain-containing protein [Kineosporiaceae bacterium]MBK7621918.1 DUF5302 domain-containing protein [Kineosporiaceae bacterium]MBK8074232.1 DUF5302 domain-containing protein [Kineosporiaceae bacterium]